MDRLLLYCENGDTWTEIKRLRLLFGEIVKWIQSTVSGARISVLISLCTVVDNHRVKLKVCSFFWNELLEDVGMRHSSSIVPFPKFRLFMQDSPCMSNGTTVS
mmetsp:Transcript_894/g.1996  ORF Transcript_894/g.1996 Transcript_894/m.1996 type:complete len:103 (-) Transcript_894:53-361(-)